MVLDARPPFSRESTARLIAADMFKRPAINKPTSHLLACRSDSAPVLRKTASRGVGGTRLDVIFLTQMRAAPGLDISAGRQVRVSSLPPRMVVSQAANASNANSN